MDANRDSREAHGAAAEPDRVSSRVVVGFGVALVLFTVVSMLVVAALFRGLDRSAEKKDATTVSAAGLERKSEKIPPLPRLQVHAVQRWKDFRSAEVERLSTYGWMDRSSGSVHVPIERAMDLIAVRGVGPLPAAPVAMPAAAATSPEAPK